MNFLYGLRHLIYTLSDKAIEREREAIDREHDKKRRHETCERVSPRKKV